MDFWGFLCSIACRRNYIFFFFFKWNYVLLLRAGPEFLNLPLSLSNEITYSLSNPSLASKAHEFLLS